jgi:uncharacterized protein
MDEKQVKDSTIFECLAGSHAYGTNTPESDVDIRGVCVLRDPSYYIGMGINRFEQKDKWEDCGDKVIYDLRKALSLMADCNPNMLDLAFCDERHHLFVADSWRKILEKRDCFLSKRVRYSYGGYAYSQIQRIRGHRSYLLKPLQNKPERVKFGLPERKLVSKEQAGAYQWLLAKIMKDSIEVMKISPEAREELMGINYIGAVQSGVPEDAMQTVKEVTGASDEWVEAIMREKRYENALKDYNSYQSWRENRNKKRQAMEDKAGYDTKHGMHLVRLFRMGIEILETGKVNVLRPDWEELLAIRNGEWPFEKIEEYAEACDEKLTVLYKTSTLPKESNRKAVDEVCVEVIKREVFNG